MNKPQHTPGPWSHQGPDDFLDFNILHPGDSLAVAAVVSNMRELPEIAANAKLIAAAPELLEALIDLADDIAERFDMDSPSTNPGIKHYIQSARDAIAKATE
ncbi:hypothetical protein OH708_07540 [Pseudomonas capsici]|uniref:hypothetical protein n=1 Tax=Pseudomonas capsici TaxID=2810614 RepID=UPI0021F16AB6|nr:hypothetical protein [Pseudomonas capsici]MCV4287757.1 hypothetical protein [Pseudomonas capsici]